MWQNIAGKMESALIWHQWHIRSQMGKVERMNSSILQGIRPRLESPLHRVVGAWVEELPSMLWSIRTTPNRSIGQTPFFLVYGAEAVLPMDIIHDCPRRQAYDETDAEKA